MHVSVVSAVPSTAPIIDLYSTLTCRKQAAEIPQSTLEETAIYLKAKIKEQPHKKENEAFLKHVQNLIAIKKIGEDIKRCTSIGSLMCWGIAAYPLVKWAVGFHFKSLQIACGIISTLSFFKLADLNSEAKYLRKKQWDAEFNIIKFINDNALLYNKELIDLSRKIYKEVEPRRRKRFGSYS